MISKNKLKYVNSLQIKKFRKEHRQFLVEGAKSVLEILNSDYTVTDLFLTKSFADSYPDIAAVKGINSEIIRDEFLEKISSFSTNNSAVAIANMKENRYLCIEGEEVILALDEIRDPGNLGTIIRTADWYGIKKIICSEQTAELYNPKVIASTMGSFTRVGLYYCDLKEYFAGLPKKYPVYGAALNGEDVHRFSFASAGFVLMGNESSGIDPDLEKFIATNITIPRYGGAESLNVAVATAVICDNVRRGR